MFQAFVNSIQDEEVQIWRGI